jgi:hypothetical protein
MPYLYQVENKITKEFYIGSRYSYDDVKSDLWVVYFTSSRYVKALIRQFGKDSFISSIIEIFDTKENCFLKEQELISKSIGNKLCLNKHYFKNGKKIFLHFECNNETKRKISLANTGKNRSNISEEEKRRWTLPGREKSLLPESKIKRKDTFSKINHQLGNKNSQYGTIWITDGINNKKQDKEIMIPFGWYRGRTLDS